MNVKIEIDTRTFVRFWLVVIGFALAALAIYSARTALLVIGISIFLAIALSPSVSRLVRVLPGKSRVLSTAMAYVVVLAALSAVVFLVVPPIVEQTVRFAQHFPTLIDSASEQYTGANEFIKHYNLQPEVDRIIVSLKNGATKFAAGVGSVLVTGIGSVVFTFVNTILVLVLTFLMLVEGPMWLSRLWCMYSDQDRMENHRKIIYRMYRVVTNYVVGQLSVSAIAGSVAGMAVFVMSFMFNVPVNLAIPTAAIVFTSSLVPMFGAMIGAFIIAVVLALNDVSASVVFLVFFIMYQQIEANYISPKIQSKRIDLSALTILLSVTVGVYVFGVVGGIISIPIAGCVGVLVEDYLKKSKKKIEKSEKPISKILGKLSLSESKTKD